MKLNEYQDAAVSTAIYPGQGSFQGVTYCALKLAGEAGEVAEKIGKVIRDDGSAISEARRQDLKKELGDVAWYVAALSKELGFTLEEVAQANIEKLASRKERGKLRGSGDDR